jgi:hypothetical protein
VFSPDTPQTSEAIGTHHRDTSTADANARRTLAEWILLALWTSANAYDLRRTTFEHVRSGEANVRALIADGYTGSVTFREKVDAVERLPCVVYIASAVKLSQGMRGALLHVPAGDPAMPVLRVLLKTNLSHDEAIAVIGHELQHVIEAATSAPAEPGGFAGTFARLDPAAQGRNLRKFETETAVAVTFRILDELKSGNLAAAHHPQRENRDERRQHR